MTDKPAAGLFMRALASVVNPAFPGETEQSFLTMLGLLENIPDRAWRSRKCLEAVATSPRQGRVPTLVEIQTAISQWLRDNPDSPSAIQDQRKAGWTKADHAWLSYWHRRLAGGFGEDPPFSATTRDNALSLLRQQSMTAFKYVQNGQG